MKRLFIISFFLCSASAWASPMTTAPMDCATNASDCLILTSTPASNPLIQSGQREKILKLLLLVHTMAKHSGQ